jgi:argininosuccinate lyase
MQNVKTNSYMLAIDLADYLVRKGLPFHQTHSNAGRLDSTAGKLVQYAIGKNKTSEN